MEVDVGLVQPVQTSHSIQCSLRESAACMSCASVSEAKEEDGDELGSLTSHSIIVFL